MVVDLPAPLGPRKPRTSPLATLRSIPDTAVIEPNFLVRPWMMIMAAGGSKGPGNIGCVPLEKSLLRRKSFLCSKGRWSRHACAIEPTEYRPRKGAGGGKSGLEIA